MNATIADRAPQLRTLLLTDLCDSTALVERIGDVAAAELFREHDGLVLELQQRWRGRLIDRSDGLLLLFERPIDGLGFALDYERGLQVLGTVAQAGAARARRPACRRSADLAQQRRSRAPGRQAAGSGRPGQADGGAADVDGAARPDPAVGRRRAAGAPRRARTRRARPAPDLEAIGPLALQGRARVAIHLRSRRARHRPVACAAQHAQGLARHSAVATPGRAGGRSGLAGGSGRGRVVRHPSAAGHRLQPARLGGGRRPAQPHRPERARRLAGAGLPHQPGAVALRQRAQRPEGARHAGAHAAQAGHGARPRHRVGDRAARRRARGDPADGGGSGWARARQCRGDRPAYADHGVCRVRRWRGVGSALDSIDEVTASLRGKLGEAVAVDRAGFRAAAAGHHREPRCIARLCARQRRVRPA